MSKESNGPIKRIEELQPLSRDHHHGLLLCWKIRTGFSKEIDAARMWRYVQSFFAQHIRPHFELEEAWVFPVLGEKHPMVQTALDQHQSLLGIVEKDVGNLVDRLKRLAQDLDDHIRFEERILFNEIQRVASREELQFIHDHHHVSEDEPKFNEDNFWE